MQINGPIRMNELDSGWFGSGFYLTKYPDYALRWGKFLYKTSVTGLNLAEVKVIGNYDKIIFLGNAEEANEQAGGSRAWIEDEHKWSNSFTSILKQMGSVC